MTAPRSPQPDPTSDRPSPHALWTLAAGDRDEYLRLMRAHGHIVPRESSGKRVAAAICPTCGGTVLAPEPMLAHVREAHPDRILPNGQWMDAPPSPDPSEAAVTEGPTDEEWAAANDVTLLRLTGEQLDSVTPPLDGDHFIDWDEYELYVPVQLLRAARQPSAPERPDLTAALRAFWLDDRGKMGRHACSLRDEQVEVAASAIRAALRAEQVERPSLARENAWAADWQALARLLHGHLNECFSLSRPTCPHCESTASAALSGAASPAERTRE